jgi:NAD(P)-dependent dehydrogenase (short-subunit alcohol dehydrogenase family)
MMTGKNFLILGAGGGIGSETCRRLRAGGSQLLLVGRNEGRLQHLSEEIDAPYKVADATSIEQVEACAEAAVESAGHLDGIVNCVGSILLKPAHLTTPAEWEDTVATNLTSAFASVRAGFKTMHKKGGSIILMSTAAARIGLPNHEAIAAAKAGVIGLMQSAAASYATKGIRINAVAPGLVKTDMTKRIWSNEKSAQYSQSMHAVGRLGEPKDVASMICWLLQPENDWVTGQVFGVDGGLGTLRAANR